MHTGRERSIRSTQATLIPGISPGLTPFGQGMVLASCLKRTSLQILASAATRRTRPIQNQSWLALKPAIWDNFCIRSTSKPTKKPIGTPGGRSFCPGSLLPNRRCRTGRDSTCFAVANRSRKKRTLPDNEDRHHRALSHCRSAF